MRVVLISDTHLQHNFSVPDGDVLIHSGDATWVGNVQEVSKFNNWLGTLPHPVKIFCAGNHDIGFERDPALFRSLISSAVYLQDEAYQLPNGMKVWGSPYQPEFGSGWAFNLSRYDGSLESRWARIPEDTNILITHGPPHGIGDLTTGEYGPPEKVGCYDLNLRVQKLTQLKLHVFGHIHCSYGVYKRGEVTYVNASICNERYKPVNKPVVIDYPE